MITTKTNIHHVRFNDTEALLFDMINEVIQDIKDEMKIHNCDILFNSHTGEIIQYDELCRLGGIFSGLADINEMYKE